jgi:hypothetical protein
MFLTGTLWPSSHIDVATDIMGDFAILAGNNLREQSKG